MAWCLWHSVATYQLNRFFRMLPRSRKSTSPLVVSEQHSEMLFGESELQCFFVAYDVGEALLEDGRLATPRTF